MTAKRFWQLPKHTFGRNPEMRPFWLFTNSIPFLLQRFGQHQTHDSIVAVDWFVTKEVDVILDVLSALSYNNVITTQ